MLILFLSLSVFVRAQTISQNTIKIHGYLSDESSGERLAGASVYSMTDRAGTIGNAYGYFSLKVKSRQQQIILTAVGYRTDTLLLNVETDTLVRLTLSPAPALLNEVIVTDHGKRNLSINQANMASLSPAEIRALPRFAGEVDVVKALQLLPGIKGGKEGSSDLHVRGGGPDQNLILLDGVPIYNSAHSLGVFSVFNADAIRSVELSKGSFPSRYGGRLSSVMDIRLKDGNRDHFRYDVSLGLISSRLLLEGPLNEKTTFMMGVRRTYLDLVAALAQRGSPDKGNYNFYDLNAKVSHQLSEKDRLHFSIYSGNDVLGTRSESASGNKDRNSLSWGNMTTAFRYNRVFNRDLFANLTLTYTDYRFGVNSRYQHTQPSSAYELDFSSKIRDAGMKMDFEYTPANHHYIRFGATAVRHDFRPNVTRLVIEDVNSPQADTSFSHNNAVASEYFLYAEDEIRLGRNLEMNAGLHFSGFHVQQKNYLSLQPRASLNWLISDREAIRASYAEMSQYIHLLSTAGTGTPADIWVPSTKRIAPQASWQSTLGYARSLFGEQLSFNIDCFYKEMNHVIEYRQGVTFLEDELESSLIGESSGSFEDKIAAGKGTAYGSEILVRKNGGQTSGWLGYTLSWSNRDLKGINQDQTYPYAYDSRHQLSLVLNHNLNDRIRLSGTWIYNSGVPATLPLSSYAFYDEFGNTGASLENVNVRNNIRMRSYHRLDLGISFVKQKKRGERSWNISVYNAYNRKNPYYIRAGDPAYNGRTRVTEYSLLPILPSFSYSYSFR
ncbi:MAG TPA: TonB-dependent receptor [Sphingobacteriaceae bacterium]